jgi:outer membrane protein W
MGWKHMINFLRLLAIFTATSFSSLYAFEAAIGADFIGGYNQFNNSLLGPGSSSQGVGTGSFHLMGQFIFEEKNTIKPFISIGIGNTTMVTGKTTLPDGTSASKTK